MMLLKPPPTLNVTKLSQPINLPKKRRLAGRRRRRIRSNKYGHKFNADSSICTISLNHSNKSKSPCCVSCKHCHENLTDTELGPEQTPFFENGRLITGGDWCYLASLLQYTGPNGLQFCPYCLATLNDISKGIPHAPYILPKYRNISTEGACKDFPKRTLEGMDNQSKKIISSGKTKENVKNFQNCEGTPLLTDKGPVLNHMSVMPLHLSLGLGLQIVNIADDLASTIDLTIREDCGESTDDVTSALIKRADILEQRSRLQQQLDDLEQQSADIEIRIQEIAEAEPHFFARFDKKLVDQSKEAVEKRKIVRQLKNNKQAIEKNRKSQDKNLSTCDNAIKEVDDWLDEQKGPFKTKFDSTIDSLGLKRQIYHSGALIGKDIDTVFGNKNNICKISSVFKPVTLKIQGQETKEYGNHHTAQVINTLFSKFSSIYSLMGPSRSLCKHEVQFITLRCISYGNWFPCNCPEENLKRKFHILTFHVPEKAASEGSVGMEAEHVSESIHPVINQLKRRYANIHSLKIQLPLVCKSQWLLSNPTICDYRQSNQKRFCKKCGKPSHYGKSVCFEE